MVILIPITTIWIVSDSPWTYMVRPADYQLIADQWSVILEKNLNFPRKHVRQGTGCKRISSQFNFKPKFRKSLFPRKSLSLNESYLLRVGVCGLHRGLYRCVIVQAKFLDRCRHHTTSHTLKNGRFLTKIDFWRNFMVFWKNFFGSKLS